MTNDTHIDPAMKILEVDHLTKRFPVMGAKDGSQFAAVDDLSFDVYDGEILGLLGESGCGKSTTAKMIMHLLPPTSGTICYYGVPLQDLPEREFWRYRRDIQMIFQNPFAALDPQMTIESALMEPLATWHIGTTPDERQDMIREMLDDCGLPANTLQKKPAAFSGGQLQRINIARALLIRPKFLIADEIVSALDVPIQNQILMLLLRMKEQMGLTVLFITHDLAVIRKLSDRVMVMKGGRKLAIGEADTILDEPDPYIQALKKAVFPFHYGVTTA